MSRRMQPIGARSASRGFTLIEMMVVVLIMGMIAVGLYQVLTTSRASYDQQKVTLEMQQNARVAIESIADDFRHVSYGKDPTQPSIEYAGPDSVTFVADILPTQPGAEKISYSLSFLGDEETPNPYDTELIKTVTDSSGAVLFSEVQSYGIKFAGLSFRYFNGQGTELPNPAPHPELIGEILIEVTAVEPRAHPRLGTYLEETLSTTIYPRNLPLTPARSRPSIPRLGGLSVPNCESVTISWLTPTTNTDGTDLPLEEISHFTIYLGTHPDSLSIYSRVARTINQWTVTGLTGGHHYYFGVTCSSRSGVESYPGLADLNLSYPLEPEIPGGFAWQQNPSGPGVRLTWSAVTLFTEGTPITTALNYQIYRGAAPGVVPSPADRIAIIPVSTWYVDTTLVECEQYYYIVTAEACGNEGAPSSEASVSLPAAPRCVASLDVEPTASSGELAVYWTPPAQRSDGSPLAPEDIDFFRVYYQTSPYVHEVYTDVAGGLSSTLLTGLEVCQLYYVNVGVIDACGHLGEVCDYNERGVRTAEACNPDVPQAIAALHAGSQADRIDLSWPANQADCDLGGYFIYYGSQAGGPYNGTGAAQGPSPIYCEANAVLDGDSCRAALSGLNPCEAFALVVSAADRCEPANQSAPSPERVVTTFCTPCAAEAGCVTWLATGTGYGETRLEVYSTNSAALTVTDLVPSWTGGASIDHVWAGRPLVKVWDSDGTVGYDGNIGPQPSGTSLDLSDFTIPATSQAHDGLPLKLDFTGDQRYQTLDLTFQTNDGTCNADPRAVSPGLFFDDFDDGNYTGWTVISGTWNVSSRTLYQSSTTSTRIIVAPGEHTNFTYEAKLKVASGYNPYLVFRYGNSTNYYTFGIVTNTDQVRFGRVQSGNFYTTAQASYASSTNTWYLLRVDVVGTTLRGYVNCEQVLEVTDAAILATGEIGLRTYASQVYFDDIRVGSLTALP